MLKFLKRADGKILLFSLLLFVLFAALSYLFPYSGDDWAWGSQIGAERLENWFADYNGRYAGNLLVMALTRNKLLCCGVMAVCLVLSCLLPSLFAGANSLLLFVLGTVLLLAIPREVFVQSVVWTSGFSNYVPPVLLTLFYFVAVKNIFGKEKPCYRPYMPVVSLVMGFVGAMFMENITVFNIVAAVFIIAYTFVRFRKIYATHGAYLVGSLSGAALMFSNSAYGLIARGEDFYRSSIFERGIIDTLTENVKESFEQLLSSNGIILAFLSVLCAIVAIRFLKASAVKRDIVSVCMYANLIGLTAILCQGRLYDWDLFFNSRGYAVVSALILFVIGMVYLLSVFIIILICIDCKRIRRKAVFLTACIAGVIAPLMLVNPIGPRCFFPPCLMLICLCVLLFSYLWQSFGNSERVSKSLKKLLCSFVGVGFAFLFGIYGVIHYYDSMRNQYVKKQTDEGFKTVVTFYLPLNTYVWTGDPDSAPWDESYKKFLGIDDDVKLKFILWEAFESFKGNFEK